MKPIVGVSVGWMAERSLRIPFSGGDIVSVVVSVRDVMLFIFGIFSLY